MNRRIAFATLAVAMVLGTAGSANAFFGMLGGHGNGCCEPSCCCEEPSCCCEEPSCGCESSCGHRHRCGLLDGLCGIFKRHNHGCCEPSCCCEEPSCCCEEPSCGCEEPSCCCEPSCRPRCCLLGGLRGLFHRHNNCCCEASCCCEQSCGCEPSCDCGN